MAWVQGELLAAPADRASGCRPQCFTERERPRAEEARVSGPPSSLHPRPEPHGASHTHRPSHSRETTAREMRAVQGAPACPVLQDCPAREEKR